MGLTPSTTRTGGDVGSHFERGSAMKDTRTATGKAIDELNKSGYGGTAKRLVYVFQNRRFVANMETGDAFREGERLLHNIQFSHPRPDVAAYMLVQFGKAILSVPVGLGATKEDAMKSAIRNYVMGSRY